LKFVDGVPKNKNIHLQRNNTKCSDDFVKKSDENEILSQPRKSTHFLKYGDWD